MSSSGKGEGLLILLSRPSTQAKLSQLRPSQIKPGGPFLNLQAEDLGLDAKVLGRKLKSALEVATEWGAVVLVDEADRDYNHIQLDELVSVYSSASLGVSWLPGDLAVCVEK
ncbi:hypothetical protein MCOR02_005728 [Pyricularia oryzae]|nr:hypothetical protein MCOR01_007671 [Pyricularia oryzae]KAH9433683.1 hypothetical protein MCOR02_005728 [Pyricularia oryzae]KAI6416408.1 hypothetical protein MCOR20_001080 [Pyricularia oryzae]KAI6470354.1 hypothetical protein MCOR15_001345 [Pyricularia oryzae]KAI6476826.1 hypothetical protein MCOR17_000852 [Pyricularia oryzae]